MTVIKHDFRRSRTSTTQSGTEEKKIPGFQLRIELCYSSPPIWRTVNLPGTISLAAFHSIIQHCFGWQDEATYRFLVGKIFYSPEQTATTGGSRSSAATRLHELEKQMGFIFSYLYDGGCGWECEITLEHLFPDSKTISHPILVEGDRASPPSSIEDIHEYQSFLDTLTRTEINRDRVLTKSGVAPSFDPAILDIDTINDAIRKID